MEEKYMQARIHKSVKKAKMRGRGPGRGRGIGWARKRLRSIGKQWYIKWKDWVWFW